MVREFIEGWDLMQILGEGTFAEVKLLVNRDTGEACAMKEVDVKNRPDLQESIRKEICVHKLLKHPNIVQCYGSRMEDDRQFIFLEYCSGGELFDRIEPESGMPEHQAHVYFKQIIDGLDFLHHRGVAHRDIKPENLLLTENDVIKISDFGLATVFRHQGKERLLERRCGTKPYIAPEILVKPKYHAEPADIWSCGIVLVAMLSGELPWDQPTLDQREYVAWKDQETERCPGPWKRIDNLPLSLLKKILAPSPSKRYTMQQIINHLWFKMKFKDSDGNLLQPDLVSPPLKRHRLAGECLAAGDIADENDLGGHSSSHQHLAAGRMCASQPPPSTLKKTSSTSSSANADNAIRIDKDVFGGFTQPAQLSDLFCSTQGTQTQGSQASQFQRLVKRMTRFWVKTPPLETEKFLTGLLEKLCYTIKSKNKGIFTMETMDRRGAMLTFRCTLIQVDLKILVDFRLSRGCGLEFKKHFAKIKANCAGIIEPGPIMWPTLIASNAIPGVPN